MTKIYTIQDFCKHFNVSRHTVYTLIQQRKLKAYKVGKAFKITENAFNDFIKMIER